MPAAAAVIVAGIGSGGLAAASGATIFGLSTTWSAIAIGVASASLSLVGQALAPKPKAQDFSAFRGTLRDRSVMIRQPVVSRKLVYGKARVSGPIVYVQSTENNTYLHLVIALASHQVQAVNDVYLDDTISTDPKFSGLVRIEKFLGTADQAASANLISESGGKWTSAHQGKGVAYLYVRLRWDENVWTNGIPSIKADVEGACLVEDPRQAGSPTYYAYTRNPALLIRHYLKDPRYGLGCDDDEIDDDYFIAAANTCDESISLAAGGTEARYTCDGVIDTANSPQEILQELLTSCGGRLVYSGGKWRLYVAAWDAPTLSFDEGDLVAPIKVRTRVSAREAFSAIKGVYVSPENAWVASDYPAIKSEVQRAALGLAAHRYKDHDLPFTTSPTAAQRLAKIELLKARQPITVEAVFNLSAFRFQAGDTVMLSNTRFGWTDKEFECVEWTLAVQQDQAGNPALVIQTVLRETVSTIYDWSTSEEQTVDDAPNTDLPDAFNIDPPGQPAITEQLYETTTGRGVAVKALISWAASPHAFVSRYEPSYRLVGATDWIVLPRTGGLTSEIPDIAPGIYDFRVQAITGIGASSDPDDAMTRQEIYGLSAAPAAPTIRGLQRFGGQAFITLDLHPALDVRIGGRLLVRHSEATSSAEWSESFSIGDPDGYPGSSVNLVLPLKSGSYLIRAEDSTGQQSATWAQVSTDGADIRVFAPVDTIQEDDEFAGSHDGCVAVDGILKLSGAGLFDDIPDFDEVSSLDDYGGTVTTGTYNFASGLDLGTKQRVRLTSLLTGIISNVNDLIDSREANIDDWVDFDGDDGGSNGDCWIEARTTDDDPASSPAIWGSWNRVDSTEVYCRGVEFRAQLRSYDAAYNMIVSQMRVKVEELA
jgi:hypothetical protein